MSDISVLAKMLKKSAIIKLEDHYSKKKAILVEHGIAGSSLEILNIPSDAIILDVDANFDNQKIFEGSNGECKRADYIIISESEEVVVFIEMKKGSSTTSKIIKQLKGSLCLFEYCQVVAREFFGRNDFLSSYKKRFITFKHVNLDKRKTKIERTASNHSTPDTLLKISWANSIQFNKIAA